MTSKNRCSCGAALEVKPLFQGTDQKGKDTFKFNGRRVKRAGRKLVCKTHGTRKFLYN